MPDGKHAILLAGALALAAACSSGAPVAAGLHQHATAVTVIVTEGGLLPAATVRIPEFATVVWRNDTKAPMQVDVEAASCGWCETVFGFTDVAGSARAVAVPAGGVATLCFHAPGTHAFLVDLGSVRLRGVVEVGGAP